MPGGKRVLMVAPTPYFSDRGCHVQIYEVARSQQINGNDVRIVTYHLGRDMPGIPTERTIPIPWYTKREAGPSFHKFYLDLLLMGKTLQVARAYRPDIIHAHLHEGAALALPLARLLNVPLLLDLQGSLTGELVNHRFVRAKSPAYRLMHLIERQIHQQVDGMLLWTYIGAALRELFVFDERKVFPVDYGVDLAAFRPYPPAAVHDLATALGLAPNRKTVVFLGLLNRYQGVDCLIEQIPSVVKRCPATQFLIMGYPNEAHYRAQAVALGIADHVLFPGRIEYNQAARYLALGDVAVSAKLTPMEGNGKLLNYLACGLPTVAFDLPGNVATLADAGLCVPLGNGEALGDALVELLMDDAQRKELARRARARAEERYSWTAIGRRIDGVYNTLIERQKRG